MPNRKLRAGLDVLNQLGIFDLIQHIRPQIGLQFLVSPDYVRDQIDGLENQQKSAFLDILFRQYGGEAFGKMKYLEFDYLQSKLPVRTQPITI